MANVSAKKLIETGAHFGHPTKRWNPKMEEYLYGSKDDIHIFDLIKTKTLLEEALDIITKASKEGKRILLVGTKKQVKELIPEYAKKAGIFYVSERFLGGTITNFKQIKKSIKKLADLKKGLKEGEYTDYTKKERLLLEREIDRLERFFGGIADMEDIPDLVIIVDVKREAGALKEANMKGIPSIAIVDSNVDPDGVTYPVPMNDDATSALAYVMELIRDAVLDGKKVKGRKDEKVKEQEGEKRSKSK